MMEETLVCETITLIKQIKIYDSEYLKNLEARELGELGKKE